MHVPLPQFGRIILYTALVEGGSLMALARFAAATINL
jgi:hypothetical protein